MGEHTPWGFNTQQTNWHFGARFIDSLKIFFPIKSGYLNLYEKETGIQPKPYPYYLGLGYGAKGDFPFDGCIFKNNYTWGPGVYKELRFVVPKFINHIVADPRTRVYLNFYDCIKEPIEYVTSTFPLNEIFVDIEGNSLTNEMLSKLFKKVDSIDDSVAWSNRECIEVGNNANGVQWGGNLKSLIEMNGFEEFENNGTYLFYFKVKGKVSDSKCGEIIFGHNNQGSYLKRD